MGREIVHIKCNPFQWEEKLMLIRVYNPLKIGTNISAYQYYNPLHGKRNNGSKS